MKRTLHIVRASDAAPLMLSDWKGISVGAHRQLATVVAEEPSPSLSATNHAIRRFKNNQHSSPLGGVPKRVTDVFIALLGTALLMPLMLMVAIFIKLTMGGPVIFAQTRIGYNGKPFRCYKFRTMLSNADALLDRHLATDPDAAREWRKSRKLKRDPRITWIGNVLRKSSLDELPQLINVLGGDMSCVGPRPILKVELENYGAYVQDYLRVRPGLTGIWQVSGRSNIEYPERVLLDSSYVRNWTWWGDWVILAKTTVAITKFDDAG